MVIYVKLITFGLVGIEKYFTVLNQAICMSEYKKPKVYYDLLRKKNDSNGM